MKRFSFLLLFALLARTCIAQPAPVREGPAARTERLGRIGGSGETATTVPAPARVSPRNDPFADGDDIQSLQAALRQCRLLASGASPSRGNFALILVGERRRLLSTDDTLAIETTQGPVELRVAAISRQKLTFRLPDGSSVHIQQ